MRTLAVLALVTPLLVTGCKKKQPEAAPAAAEAQAERTETPAPATTVEWKYGPARFVGEATDGTLGKFRITIKAQNDTAETLTLSALSIGAKAESGARVCVAEETGSHQAEPGEKIKFETIAECAFSKLPEGENIPVLGTLTYTLGGQTETISINTSVKFNQ